MPCVLRVSGKKFAPDQFAKKTSLPICAVYRQGTLRATVPKSNKKWSTSGLNIEVSNSDFENLAEQIKDAHKFLDKYQKELKQLSKYPGVEFMTLDFGISQHDVEAQFEYFPPELLQAASKVGIGLEISLYRISRRE
jgi:hypothetical protein